MMYVNIIINITTDVQHISVPHEGELKGFFFLQRLKIVPQGSKKENKFIFEN